ncbi:outer membrane protein [Phenylobacterium zucineum]|uniref:outer membrane protein n=1 Tax=Phenylobacterium zucineum TaxID=284016 RepID=UPI0003096C02|nr:outer membrane beta-barrel protein [Phenylobacterium zucineum]
MKKNLFAAAAVVAFLGSAVAANAQTIGHVGANYSRVEADTVLGDAEGDVWQAEGSVRFDAGSLGAAIDGSITDYEGDTAFGATGHLNTQVAGGLLGGFAGVETNDDVTLWGVGVDGQFNLAPTTTLYGQAGYGNSDDLGDADLWAVRGELRQYVTDDFKLQASAGFVTADSRFGDFDGWNLGAEAEYKFTGSPVSVLVGYDRFDSNDLDLESDTFRVGVRYTFGGSIRERDQSGAALGSVAKLFGAGLIR